MKNYKAILADIKRTTDKMEEVTAKIEALDFSTERRAAANSESWEDLKALHEKAKGNAETIAELCESLLILKISKAIMWNNFCYSLSVYGLEVLRDIMPKYNGKKAGEKTRDNFREEVKAHGITIYFEREFMGKGQRAAEVNLLNSNGYTVEYKHKGHLYTQEDSAFIDHDNIFRLSSLDSVKIKGEYVENITARARAIVKAHKALKKEVERASAAQAKLNALLPADINRFDVVSSTGYIKEL